MASKRSPKLDFSQFQTTLQRQFSNLDPKDPSLWPVLPKLLLCIMIAVVVIGIGWYMWLQDAEDQLKAEQATELTLREDYTKKLTKAISLEALKKQREQVQQYVTQLEKQLPSKAEMSALLSDINQAGLGRSLQFETFRPGQVVLKDYYAELPIAVRVTGNYPDIGAFASDIANLSRIVTLNNLSLSPVGKEAGTLAMEATAKTFRYLDQEEILEQKKAADAARKKK
ncbi:type 4a pilus biogenesis protein PilO [Diaphorobacter ruginosibacter]|uniref:Type 4a pilus biogenesis protein PilO n=1 Tax=Diaphorobacter ruginosibacter TaxID=1715720 RepID=A0A7G9RQZ6_9BURK|nr:type 4a pilus biogenesis protein PilO [Diaphorobacter ruginosibacter]QNN58021.1 type 4a pilus biogenesis protein PilO [Diaphorobacter ruginosibacter]